MVQFADTHLSSGKRSDTSALETCSTILLRNALNTSCSWEHGGPSGRRSGCKTCTFRLEVV